LILSGALATAFPSCFLHEMRGGSPLPVREPPSFQQERKQDGYQQTTSEHAGSGNLKATIWQNSSEKGPFFAATFSRPFKDESGAWRNATSFGLHDLEALLNVALEAKEWISAPALKP
jgi:hypothetical protein